MTLALRNKLVLLPCGHKRVHQKEGAHRCSTCKRTFHLELAPAHHASEMTGSAVPRIRWGEERAEAASQVGEGE